MGSRAERPRQQAETLKLPARHHFDWGPGYGICLAKDGDALVVLFGGGTKRRQQTDIDRAKILHVEYKDRKAAQLNAAKRDSRKR